MYSLTFKEFLKLSRRGNVIPIYKEINADLDTPVSAYLKIASGDFSFLLESVEGQEKIARYSFLGANPALVLRAYGKKIQIIDKGRASSKRFTASKDPLDEIRQIMQTFKPVAIKELPRFSGGMVGFMGYDMGRFFENIPDKNPDKLNLPDMVFMLTDTILIFDHVRHTIKIVANVILPDKKNPKARLTKLYKNALNNITQMHKRLNQPLAGKEMEFLNCAKKVKVSSNYKKSEFQDMVRKAKKYIRAGDIIQVALSQRFSLALSGQAFDVYRRLRGINPSPYMFFLKLDDISLVGASPELLVRCEDAIIQTRPIAGTRPRGKNEEEDKKLEEELLNDAKEKAEHIMLVDLGRNDLGRVAKSGKVQVSQLMKVERYSHVMHIVSEVKALLDEKFDAYSALRACFPAGTVSGSPKVRAMEIIDELENTRRGPYAGCVGYFGFSQNMDTCITIRTIVIKQRTCYIQAGAGIVADSRPEKEYYETVNKAKALIEAISVVTCQRQV
ncbi:MAG: anthranilate synthase component I [Candidatus Omnitrophica bacterium]|jgi:anthranilate synthase component 1|nr:anthranilate synthase component I [Candidatus Omnitrophota bacterium]